MQKVQNRYILPTRLMNRDTLNYNGHSIRMFFFALKNANKQSCFVLID